MNKIRIQIKEKNMGFEKSPNQGPILLIFLKLNVPAKLATFFT